MNQSLNTTDYYECEATNAILTLGVKTLFQALPYFVFNWVASILLVSYILYFFFNLKDEVRKSYLSATSLLWLAYTIICIAQNYFTITFCLTKNSFELYYMFRIFTFTVSIYSYLSLLVDTLKERYPFRGDRFVTMLPTTCVLLLTGSIIAATYCSSYYISRWAFKYYGILVSFFICLLAYPFQIYFFIRYKRVIEDILQRFPIQDQTNLHARRRIFDLIFTFIIWISVLQMLWHILNRVYGVAWGKSWFEELRESCFNSGCAYPTIFNMIYLISEVSLILALCILIPRFPHLRAQ